MGNDDCTTQGDNFDNTFNIEGKTPKEQYPYIIKVSVNNLMLIGVCYFSREDVNKRMNEECE